ncbi:hypothetical protein BmHG_00768 [Borrelia miyamotoi]|uniref:Uncharacterized protein n=1 Tax=Borrelia miyamotoi TaxID=47466 RepID=A0AAP8YV58_9SPIR|nr:hypothetical protein [Borrelia miyamotoi]AHH04652.1 Hypothetical protein BOM_0109 [Borrelia miyamotoi FR64b]ATQ14515.1 hypothetical protein CNO14_00495 [Borrelia miyamotoi]ATQ15700.1 hypothetical protein CNO13_00495 [Borrelia miyamotoi]ATQ16844.1 hypothetical protein CNO12_00495 [Borrelia miyamotoi]ATQ18652.1 hypothetical protein CNO11_03750 [Borrelia miyamotoi]
MTNHKNSFFIKQGPEEVDFDMDSVFVHHSVIDRIGNHPSEEFKDLLDEKLLKLDYSLKQRHGELVDYLKKVEGRISRFEEQILGRSFSSLQEFDNPNLKAISFIGSQDEANVKDNEFSELVKKENNLPSVSLDQEELDALLGGLNEISINNKKGFGSSNDLENDLDIGVSFEKTPKNESNILDVNHNLSSIAESFTHNVVDTLLSKEDGISLGVDFAKSHDDVSLDKSSSLGVANVVNSDDGKSQNLMIISGEDDKVLTNVLVDRKPVNVGLKINDNSHLDSFSLNENSSNVKSLQEKNTSYDDVQDNLEKVDYFLDNGLDKVKSLDKDSDDLKSEKFKEKNEKLSDFDEITVHKMDSVSLDLDVSLNKGSDSIDDGGLKQNKEVDNISSDLKKLDNFEDVLKADLDCLDLQEHIKDFEEENLYDSNLRDLEEKLEQDEELGSSSLEEQTEDAESVSIASDFSFADVETIINKFNDSEYLSKIKLNNEERAVLVRFISRLEGDLESKSGSNNFTIKREYEILQKIKRLFVRE